MAPTSSALWWDAMAAVELLGYGLEYLAKISLTVRGEFWKHSNDHAYDTAKLTNVYDSLRQMLVRFVSLASYRGPN